MMCEVVTTIDNGGFLENIIDVVMKCVQLQSLLFLNLLF
jgi:hypothetical protein